MVENVTCCNISIRFALPLYLKNLPDQADTLHKPVMGATDFISGIQ